MYLTHGTQILDSDEASLEELQIADMATLNCSGRLLGGMIRLNLELKSFDFRQGSRLFGSCR